MNSTGRQKAEHSVSDEICSTPADKTISGEHWRFCPQCGHELINEKCKLRCPRCHYFMSCSDFDFAN
jgi:ribosomal protein S27AE